MRRRLLPLLCLLGLAGCSCEKQKPTPQAVPDAGPRVLLEKEPNDSTATALVIDGSAVVEANLGADPAHPDADWYALTASLPRTADLVVTAPPGADVAMEVVDEAGTVLAAVNEAGPGGSERLPNLDVSGKAWVRVVAVKKGVGGAYTLTVTLRDRQPGYELEPNDRRADATQVALGQAVSGLIGHPGDADWFRYELPSDEDAPADAPTDVTTPADLDAPAPLPNALPVAPLGDDGDVVDAGDDEADGGETDAGTPAEPRLALRVDVSAVEGVAFEVQVVTEAETVLFSAKGQPGAPLSLRNLGVRLADRALFVVLRSTPIDGGKDKAAHRGANPDVGYTLTVAPEEAGDSAELEPNDEPGDATPLPANSYRDGFISPRGDVDYFELLTDGPQVASFSLEGVEKVDLVLSLVQLRAGGKAEVVLRSDEGGVKAPERLTNVACDGRCLVRVEGAAKKVAGQWVRDQENADQPYRLSAQVTPDDGSLEREPNDTPQTATRLEPGQQVRGTVYPKKDVDYFSLDLRDAPVKTPLAATLLGVRKVDVGLYLHRVEDDGKLTLVQTSDSAKGDKPERIRYTAEPGLYVFEVRDAAQREANPDDSYQLTVEVGD